jgi:3-phenylpropionate/trans-cinnamate dioxygenase ferredoxin reductase component
MAAVRYLLIGGGLASATAAEQIRKRDADGSITLVGAEPHLPYHRPPLSKEYLRGDAQVEETFIQPESFYAENGITLRRGVRVTALDTAARAATLDSGEQIPFEKALIATGAEPRRLRVPGVDLPGVHLLRTLDDSTAIRAEIERGARRALIVGGGYIGVEVAGDCLLKGLQVTLVEPLSQLWGRFAGPEVAGFLAETFRERGAELLFGEEVVGFTGDGRVRAGKTKSGRELACDFAVVGIGVTPRVELAKAAGLAVDERQGIRVNEYLESSAPHVWAAGDATCFHDPVYGRDWHVEHWNNGFWHGEIAGANMAGERIPYDHVPNFFSDVLDLHMELFGDSVDWKRTLLTGDRAAKTFAELYLDANDAIQMVIAFNPAEDQFETLEQIARRRPSVHGREAEIRKPGFDLKSLVA